MCDSPRAEKSKELEEQEEEGCPGCGCPVRLGSEHTELCRPCHRPPRVSLAMEGPEAFKQDRDMIPYALPIFS